MELKPLQVKIIQRLSKTNKSEELRNKLRSWIVTNEVSVTDLLYNIEQKNVIVSSSILNKLGLLYGQGKEGLVENPETAFLFYLTSAKLGNASANGNVAQYYYDGRAIGGQNLELAYQFCLKSLLLGGDKNMLMGEILFESENYVEAIKYLRKILDTNTESKSFEKQRLRSEARELEKSCLFQLLNSTFPEINLGLVGLNSSSYEQNSSFLSSPSTPIAVPASDTPKRPQLALSLLANSLSKNLQIYTDISTSGAIDGTVNNSKYNNNVSTPYNRTASPSNMRLSSTKNVNSNNGNHSTPTNGQPLLLTPTSTKHKTTQSNGNGDSGVFVFVNHKSNNSSNNNNNNNNSNITPRGSNTPRNGSNNNNPNNNYNSFYNSNNINDNNNSINNNNSSNNNSSTMLRLASPMRHNLNTTVDASVFVKKLLTHECPGWFYVTDNLDGFDQNSCMELTAKAKILELECVAIKSAYESAEAHIELARKNNFSKEIIKILVSTKVSEFEEVYRKLEQNKVTLLEAWNKYIDTDEHTLRRQIHMENLFFSAKYTANYHTYNLAKHFLARRVYDGTVDVRSSYGASDAYGSTDAFGVSTYLSNGNENNGAEPIYLSKFSAQKSDNSNSSNSSNNSTIPNAKVLITAERALLETAIVAYGRASNSIGAAQKAGWTAFSSEANNTNSNAVKTPKTPTNISYNGITNGTSDVNNSNSKSVTHNISYNHAIVQNNNTNNNSNNNNGTNNNSSNNNSGKPSTPISPTRAVFNVTHVNRPLSPSRIQQQNSVTTTPTNNNSRNDVSFNTNNSNNITNELNNNDVDQTTNTSNNHYNNNSNTSSTNTENDERSFIATEYTHPETVVLGETILKYKHSTTTVLTMNNSSNNNHNSELPLDFIILNEPALENSSTVLAFIYKLLNIPLYFYTMNAKNSAQLSADREQYVLLESHLATLIHAFVSKGQLITLQNLSTLNDDISESDVHTLNKLIYTVFVKHIVKYVVSGGQNRNNNKGNSNNNNIVNNGKINSQNMSPMRINNSNINNNSNSNTNNLTNNSTQRVGTNTTTTTTAATNANVSDTQLPLATAVSRALSLIKLGVLTFYELFNSESEYSVLCGFGYSGVIDNNNSGITKTQQQLTLREKIIKVNHLYIKAIMENSNAYQYRDIVQFWKQHGNSGLMIPTYKALCEELATTYGSGVNDTVSYLEPLHVIADFQDFELENLLKKIEI